MRIAIDRFIEEPEIVLHPLRRFAEVEGIDLQPSIDERVC